MNFLTLLISVPVTLFAVSFALSNTEALVSVGLWPFEEDFSLPLPVFALGLLGCGFFLGALFVWILSQRTVFRYWQEKRRGRRMEVELDDLHKKMEAETDRKSAGVVADLPLSP